MALPARKTESIFEESRGLLNRIVPAVHRWPYESEKSLCVFDFDGTIVDSMEAFADLAGTLISENYHLPFPHSRKLYLQTSGVPFFQQLEILFPNDLKNAKIASAFEQQKTTGYFDLPLCS